KKKEEQEFLEMKKKLASKEERELMHFNEEMKVFLDDLQVKKTEIDAPDLRQYMDEIEVLLRQITECIEEHPEMISGTGHLISYYLPCMTKLLTTYEDLEEQPIQGDNILKTKKEIEDSFLTIRSALTNMYDELFLNVSMDISSDIQVMNAILAQDGLNDGLHNS
ncbi:MAG: 5-bromo-4-chloroindolyl phosphate hydrolysis family protein, partial [Eubacterium sp.]|nr:5-bromo-4-chloroindolyl phosphate hydrolysis family protein [Eubacterium sp.]